MIPFHFYTRLNLVELLGRRAVNVRELLEGVRVVPGTSIYHHTHRFLQQHHYLSPEPPNDFAFWVTTVLQEESLGERLAAIDTIRYAHLRDLRSRLVGVIEEYLQQQQTLRVAPPGEEFHFMDAVSFMLPTGQEVSTLAEFDAALTTAGVNSIAYHLLESRLRLEAEDNDFSRWLEKDMGERDLAAAIRTLDPYTHTLKGLRRRVRQLVGRRLGSRSHAEAAA